MLTEAQIHYLEDVLGASSAYFRVDQAPVAGEEEVPATAPVLLITGILSAEESALLGKILASIGLEHFEHRQVDIVADVISDLDFAAAPHVFVFDQGQKPERTEGEICVWWSFPALGEMTGAGENVTSLKKGTWNLLQRFAKEIK